MSSALSPREYILTPPWSWPLDRTLCCRQSSYYLHEQHLRQLVITISWETKCTRIMLPHIAFCQQISSARFWLQSLAPLHSQLIWVWRPFQRNEPKRADVVRTSVVYLPAHHWLEMSISNFVDFSLFTLNWGSVVVPAFLYNDSVVLIN